MSKTLIIKSRKGEEREVIVDNDFDTSLKLSLHPKGYIFVRVNGKKLLLHRYVMNAPKGVKVDHINRNKTDCRRENLRFATSSQNNYNQEHKGVSYYKPYGKWQARIKLPEKRVHLGYFETEEEALEAYQQAHAEHFGEFSPYYKGVI